MAPQTAWRQQQQPRPRQGQRHGSGRQAAPSFLGNLQSFFVHSSPIVPVQGAEEGAGPSSSHFSLRDLWTSYDEWSAYGVEIPMRVNVEGSWQEIIQCYVPYLSGMQLFGADHPARRIRSPSSGYSSCDEDATSSGLYSGSDSGCSSACTSSTASTASVDSDSEAESKDSPVGGGPGGGGGRKGGFRDAAERGSVLQKQQPLGEPGKPLFEFFEEESPYARAPLADRVAELAEEFPGLLSLSSAELHPASWFAVAWYPIYRVPSLADPALSRDLQASLLTFHSLAVQPSLPAELHLASAGLPIPPPLCAPAAAALAWRSETARQHLLASALTSLAAVPAQSSCPPAAVATTSCDVEPEDGSCQPQQPAVSVACLRPFAFMPYKLSGRTWVDDYNLRTQHLPMISAAGCWLERRKARLPDFEFMSRTFRPLPVGYHR